MPSGSVLQGELGLLSLFDLGQLLMLNRATGELTVVSEGRRGYFYFDGGSIVNAVDDEYHEGEGAAFRMFTWKSGRFEFEPSAATGARAITENTEGLMMEAARRMDEAGIGGDGGEVDRLAQRASSLESLREAFQSVASETAGRPELGSETDGSAFELLREPGDALLFRPGHAVRARNAGRWRAMGKHVLDAPAYEQLRSRLLDAGAPAGGPHAPGARTRVVTLENDRRYSITHLPGEQEALWVRAAALSPPTVARLEGEVDTLDTVLASPSGLLLVSGPDAGSAERLFHACVARVLETRGGTLLLLADHERWAHADRAGAVLPASAGDAAELARAASPDVAAFDLAHAPHAIAAFALVPRVLAAVVSPDPGGALARWCALVGRHWGDGVEAPLAGTPIDVVHADGAAAADGRLAFSIVRLALGAGASAPTAPVAATAATTTAGPGTPRAAAPAPAATTPAEAAPPPSIHTDVMAALAAELTRTLRKAA